MAKNKKATKQEDLNYLAFLEKRVNSKNYKANVSPEEYAKTKEKYDKMKVKIKLLYDK